MQRSRRHFEPQSPNGPDQTRWYCWQPSTGSEKWSRCQQSVDVLSLPVYHTGMSEVTRILDQIQHGDVSAAEQLLPLVYDELRKLAADKMANERPGQTLQATALVHEAYIRLIDSDDAQRWNSRGHFFAAAAEAMRRILVDNARHKQSKKRGGDRVRLDLDQLDAATSERLDDVLDIDAALGGLANADSRASDERRRPHGQQGSDR